MSGVEKRPQSALLLFGACLVVALALFLAAALPLGSSLSLLTPLPVAYCYFRARPVGLAVALAGTLAASLPAAGDPRLVSLVFLELAAAGVVVGELLRRRLSPEATIGLGVIGVAFTSLGVFLVHAAVVGQPPAVLAAAYAAQTLDGVRENLLALGYTPEADLELVLDGLTRLLPAVFVLALAALVSLNTVLARRFLRALGETGLPEWPVFGLWQAPEHLVWVLIGAGLAIAVGVWPARLVGLNLLTLTAVVYFLQGLAVAAFFCEKKRVPRPLRYLAYALLALQQYLSLATAVVGLCDLWIDFRRLKQAAVKEA